MHNRYKSCVLEHDKRLTNDRCQRNRTTKNCKEGTNTSSEERGARFLVMKVTLKKPRTKKKIK